MKNVKEYNKCLRFFYEGFNLGKKYKGDDAGIKYMNLKFKDLWEDIENE